MEKKYLAPEVEVIEVEVEAAILTLSGNDDSLVDIGGNGVWD